MRHHDHVRHGHTIWQRMANPRIIAWPTFWIATALFALESLVGVLDGSFSIAGGIAFLIASQIVLYGLLFLARVMYLRRGFAMRHALFMVLTVVLASFISVTAGQITLLILELSPDQMVAIGLDAFIARIVVVFIVGLIWVALVDYRAVIAELRKTREQLEETKASGQEALIEQRQLVLDRIDNMISQAVTSTAESDPRKTELALRVIADDVVRPLSHNLATTAPAFAAPQTQQVKSATWRSVAEDVTQSPWISPLLMAALVTVISVRFTVTDAPSRIRDQASETLDVIVDTSSLITSFAFLAMMFVVVWITAVIVQRITRRYLKSLPLGRRFLVLGAGLMAIILAMQIVIFFYEPARLSSSLGLRILASVPVVLIAVVIGGLRAVAARWRLTQTILARANEDLAWEVAKTQDVLWQERRSMARALHGPLQSAMRAGAQQLSAMSSDPGLESSPQAVLDRVRQAVSDAVQPVGEQVALVDHLDSLQRTWSGVCEVITSVSSECVDRLSADRVCRSAAMDILTEAVANAAIHAKAEHIFVSMVVAQDRSLVIEVQADGQISSNEPVPGLGSRILDDVCLEWQLELADDTSKLRAVLPLE
jgi:signal transduction histidine kinase